jgi:hypothetical protein
MDLPSFHDDHLVAYAVDCEKRQLTLRINAWEGDCISTVTFSGLEGYCLEGDALGNVVFDLTTCDPTTIITDFNAQIAVAYRKFGAPGPWAADLSTAGIALSQKGVRGYRLSASFGMSGWILARGVSVEKRPLSQEQISSPADS